MTSNLGSDIEDLKRYFRPEFINRIDDIISFNSLDEVAIKKIVGLQIERLKIRLADHKITLDVDEDVLVHLAKVGYDPHFGARPIKRLIMREIENPISKKILSGELANGGHLHLRFDQEIHFDVV